MLSDWRRVAVQVTTQAQVRTEVVWFNFAPQRMHWASHAGRNATDRQRIKRKATRWAQGLPEDAAGRTSRGALGDHGRRGPVMARINQASLRAQLDDCRAQFEAIKQHGEASADTLALINTLFMLVDIVVAVFLERTTPKTSRNSGLPSSRDGTDGGTHTEGKSGSRSRGPKARHARSDNLRTVTTTHTSAVTECRQCRAPDLG